MPSRVVQNGVLLWLYPGAIGVVSRAWQGSPGRRAQRGDERLVAVVLGAPGEPFSAAATLLNYVRRLRAPDASQGEPLDDVDVGGGASR
jgi:hypothetical protein